jgi:hypothetical protein
VSIYSIPGKLVFLLVFFTRLTFASNDNIPVGARSSGMGHASVTHTGFWSVFHNQAGLAFVDDLSVGVSYHGGFLPQMSDKFFGMVYSVNKGAFAFSSSYYGYSRYYELKSGLAYGMLLAPGLSAGVQMDYFHTHVEGLLDDVHFVTFEIGLMYQVHDKVRLGFHAFNPLYYQIYDEVEDVPVIMRFGVGYQVTDNLVLCSELEKENNFDMNYKLGVEYHLLKGFFLRTGFHSLQLQNSFGIGYQGESLQIDFSFVRHQTLGYHPGISINYFF